MLTNVSSNVTVTGSDRISVTVDVAVGATVLNTVMNPDELVDEGSGGAPPEGSTTIVPGRPESGMVISPVPSVTVMMPPPVLVGAGVMVADTSVVLVGDAEVVAESVAVAESDVVAELDVVAGSDVDVDEVLLVGLGISAAGGGDEGWGSANKALTGEVQSASTVPSFCTWTGIGVMAKYPVPFEEEPSYNVNCVRS